MVTALDAATLVAQVVVALTAALITKRLRPALVLMGITLVATAAAVVRWLVFRPMACFATNLPIVDLCEDTTALSVVGVYWHNKIVFGSVVAIPVVLVVLALMMLARSRPDTAGKEHATARPLKPVTLAGLSAIAACLVAASALPGAGRWLPFEPATTTGECLVGTWREISGSRTLPLSENISIPMTTTGEVWTINSDGTTRQDFGTGAVHKGEYKSIPVVVTLAGTADFRYDIEDGKIHLHPTTVSGRHSLRIGNAPGRDRPLAEVIDSDSTLRTTCDVDRLTASDGNWTQEFARVTN